MFFKRADRKYEMLIKYSQKNFHQAVILGIILQFFGGFAQPIYNSTLLEIIGWSIILLGTGLLMIGFSFYAKSKGRNPAWSMLALLSIVGWFVLICLKDKSSFSGENNRKTGR